MPVPLLSIVLGTILLTACGAQPQAPPASAATPTLSATRSTASEASSTTSGTVYPLTITDDTGHNVTIPHRPTRIVSLTLGTDEILLGMGERSRLVAVTSLATDTNYSFVAVQAKGLPGLSANAEKIVALRPDLVLAGDYNTAGVIQQIRAAGVPVVELSTFSSLGDVETHIRLIGRITDEPAAAQRMVTLMQQEVAKVESEVAGQPRPRVVFYSDGYLYGTGTTIDQVIADAGGIDAAAAAGFKGYTQVGAEEIVKLNPDVILTDGTDSGDVGTGPAARQILADPAYKGVSAVKQKQVWALSSRADSDVGQYMAWDVQDVAALLHPAQVKPYSP